MHESHYERLHGAYESARHLPKDQWTAALELSCDGDSALMDEALELLRLDDSSGDSGGSNPLDLFADERIAANRLQLEDCLAAGLSQAPQGWIPESVGPYRILRKIGEGGMGVVFAAEQDAPRRQVAIKLIYPSLANRERLGRFRREAELLGRLQHPGIAQIYGAGEFDAGRGIQPYFAMELIDGVALDSYATVAKLTTRDRLEMVALISDAIQHAHDCHVVHRDLKPDNILVTSDGRPVILDFGVARTTESESLRETLETVAGQIVGTLAYMAPEQIDAALGEVTSSADIYALGAVAHELLTGRTPHLVAGLGVTEAMRLVTETSVGRISRLDRSLGGDVETIIGKALEKAPDRRYESAAAFAADIRRWIENRPIAARPPSRIYLARKFAQRHRGVVASIAALFLSLVVSVTLAIRTEALRESESAAKNEMREGLYHAQMMMVSTAAEDSGSIDSIEGLIGPWRDPAQDPDLRGWEWHHFDAVSRDRGLSLSSECYPTSLAWHPNGRHLAVGGLNDLEIFDQGTHARLAKASDTLDLGVLNGLAWDRSGQRLCCAGDRGIYMFEWDAVDESLKLQWSDDRERPAWAVEWHPREDKILVGFSQNSVRAMSAAGPAETDHIARHKNLYARSLAISPDGQMVAVPLAHREVNLLHWDSLRHERVIPAPTNLDEPTSSISWHPKTGAVAMAGLGSPTVIYAPGWIYESALPKHAGGTQDVAWSLDGTQVLTVGNDAAMRVWDRRTTKRVATYRGCPGPVQALALRPDGNVVATCSSQENEIHLWPLNEWRPVQRWTFSDERPAWRVGAPLTWSPDGTRLDVHRVDERRSIFPRSDAPWKEDPPHSTLEEDVINCDGTIQAFLDQYDNHSISLLYDPGGQEKRVKLPEGVTGRKICWHPHNPHRALLINSGRVDYLDLEVGDLPTLIFKGPGPSAEWSPDGQRIGAASARSVQVYTVATGSTRSGSRSEKLGGSVVSFSPDGSMLAVGSEASMVTLYDVETLSPRIEIRDVTEGALSLAWHPSQPRLAIGAKDGAVYLIETSSGRATARLELGDAAVGVTWSPSGKDLVALSENGMVCRWSTR